jgi:methionyl-tRNA formyltransferase
MIAIISPDVDAISGSIAWTSNSRMSVMQFAITAVDRYLGIFEAFVRAGWKPLKLFTVPMKSDLASQRAVIAYAEQQGAAIQLSRMGAYDLEELREQGCEALIVASYDWKIDDWRPFLKYAVNFHCSPLPDGRGPYPVVRAILENRNFWGVACHRLTPKIDSGEILAVEEFPLRPDECHESLDLKIQMAAKRLATRVAGQFTELWEAARPQEGGVYWKNYELAEHIINFQSPVDDIMRHIRAFGANGSLASISKTWITVTRAIGWTERHNHPPGVVVHVFNRSIVVAASDGYIGILESQPTPLHVVVKMQPGLNSRSL